MITKIALLAGLVAGIICGKGFFHSERKALKKIREEWDTKDND